MSQIKMLNTIGLTEAECKFVSDCWLGEIAIDEVIGKMYRASIKEYSPQQQAEKALAIRTRYMQLDMIMIGQEMDRFFLGEGDYDEGGDNV